MGFETDNATNRLKALSVEQKRKTRDKTYFKASRFVSFNLC